MVDRSDLSCLFIFLFSHDHHSPLDPLSGRCRGTGIEFFFTFSDYFVLPLGDQYCGFIEEESLDIWLKKCRQGTEIESIHSCDAFTTLFYCRLICTYKPLVWPLHLPWDYRIFHNFMSWIWIWTIDCRINPGREKIPSRIINQVPRVAKRSYFLIDGFVESLLSVTSGGCGCID